MTSPREWSQERLFEHFPALADHPAAPVRCTAACGGEGTYLNYSAGERRGCARLKLEIEPADTLCARFEHEWPSDWDAAQAETLDAAILKGVVDAIVHERPPLRFGRVVTRSIVHYEGSVTPVAFSIAAAMAMQDAAKRAGWDPDPPGHDDMRTFGRIAS
jgi:hypothetical protein